MLPPLAGPVAKDRIKVGRMIEEARRKEEENIVAVNRLLMSNQKCKLRRLEQADTHYFYRYHRNLTLKDECKVKIPTQTSSFWSLATHGHTA
jgi:hypothetical protein